MFYCPSKEFRGTDLVEHEQERTNYFKQFGYDTLIIWEQELKDVKTLKHKLNSFVHC